jgi:hypothetical protein
VFLDVDGVLHPFPANETQTFHESCMHALKKLVSETKSEIVLSSSWRNFEGTRNTLQQALNRYGMSFVGWIAPDDAVSATSSSIKKLSKILAFVGIHSPAEWIVLDDEDLVTLSGEDPSLMMTQLFSSRFLRTDPQTGMTDADAEAAIKLIISD